MKRWGGGEASKEERESGVVSVVESLTTAEQTHASERRTEEGERPFNFQLQAEKDFIEGVLKICPHYCIQNCDLAGGEKKIGCQRDFRHKSIKDREIGSGSYFSG